MNTQIRHAASSLVGISIVLTLMLAFPEVNRSRAKARAVALTANLEAGTTAMDEGSATLSPANLNISAHFYPWYTHGLPYCGPLFEVRPAPEDIPGSIVAGFIHRYDKGARVFGCPDGSNTVYRGAVWFDLSDIISKAPPLHVSVESATLHFKQSGECPGELLYGTADWMKSYPEDTLVPGSDPLATLPSGFPSIGVPSVVLAKPCGDCSIDVKRIVNNWLAGEEHGGYANYGFVFKGMREADSNYTDADSCVARYGDFSLTVNYKYDKEPPVVLPKKPDTPVVKTPGGTVDTLDTRKNCALASNGGNASASSTMTTGSFSPSTVIDGERRGITFLTGGGWISAAPTNNDWLQVDFSGRKTINEIDVWMLRDDYTNPAEPGSDTKVGVYGLTDFEVQYWNQFGAWVDVPGGKITDNHNVLRQFTFPDLKTNKIRVQVHKTPDGYSRLTEVEALCK